MRDEYENARKRLGISECEFRLVAPNRHAKVSQTIIDRFTALGKRGLHAPALWESFKNQAWSASPDSPLDFIREHIVPGDEYWLLGEAWTKKEESAFWLYEAIGDSIIRILAECHYHEFYIIDRKMTWLICENHHGLVIACGSVKNLRST